jgi:hypothetical protein
LLNSDTAPILVRNNQANAARDQKMDPELAAIINTAGARTGLTVSVFSGGQMSEAEYESYDANRRGTTTENGTTYQTLDGEKVRTGTTRHDIDAFGNGKAADIWLYNKDGKRIRLDLGANHPDTILAGKFVEELRALGAQGIGGGAPRKSNGKQYMGGVGLHVDLSGKGTWELNSAFNSYLAEGDRRFAAGETPPGEIFFGTKEVAISQISQLIIDQGIYENEEEEPRTLDGSIIQSADEFHTWATSRGVSGITVNEGSNHNVQEGTIFIHKSMFGATWAPDQKGLIVTNSTEFTKWNSIKWGGWISYNLGATGISPLGGLTKEESANPNARNAEESTSPGPESSLFPKNSAPGIEIPDTAKFPLGDPIKYENSNVDELDYVGPVPGQTLN